MKRLTFIFMACFLFMSGAKADDTFSTKHSTFKHWLGGLAQSGSRANSIDFQTFKYMAPIAANRFLMDPANGWTISKILNFNMEGLRISSKSMQLPMDQSGAKDLVLIQGYYLVSKKIGSKVVKMILSVSDFPFCRTGLNLYFHESDTELADQVYDDLILQTTDKNIYKNGVLHLVKDQWSYQCFTFLENVDTYSYAWEDLIADKGMKASVYRNTFNLIKNFDKLKAADHNMSRGMILHGPPGTGKSFVGQILISQLLNGTLKDKITMLYISARHLTSADSVAKFFTASRKLSTSIIFMEDIDLIGIKSRNMNSNAGDAKDKIVLNEFLNGMDGLINAHGSIFIGTTNRVENVDAALSRSGRLGMHYYFGLPNYLERKEFFERFTRKKMKMDAELTMEWLAGETEGLTGADIIEIISLAKQTAFLDGSKDAHGILLVSQAYFVDAINRVRNNDSGMYDRKALNYFDSFKTLMVH